ncbi:Ig-like domain repeat protein [Streptomyces yaanensis]|uniref:Ig-like domain repeat protein n=1 Tax=Streptomyces yaanensis TaxID=1142239 RepID=A0ABV7S9J5_9ACTN|nr:Ig-like domain repeat protein [Streptomyces sp. CGMCC 4.7035]WNB96742.1 Ig-like domain repeat protein [Streptomyces sp. CGMCC 4.7035]
MAASVPAQAIASTNDKRPVTDPKESPSRRAVGTCLHEPDEGTSSSASTRHRPSPRHGIRQAADVFIIDASASANSTGGEEPSIAVNPNNPNQVAITRFGPQCWNLNASLLYTSDGGQHWTNENSIPPPTGWPTAEGCPCDQTIDYGRDGRLYGTFQFSRSPGRAIVTGSTTDPTNPSAWKWNGNPAQLTNNKDQIDVDQPWLLVNRDPQIATQDNVYVLSNEDFGSSGPSNELGYVSYGADPVDITVMTRLGGQPSPHVVNPAPRLATDHRNGTVYALYQQSTTPGTTQPKNVTYKLNRSTDAGHTWTLNGSVDGLTLNSDPVPNNQSPGYKFAGNTRVEGGVHHVAVDPSNGDVYVVYGETAGGNNQLKILRLTSDGAGGLSVGTAYDVSTSTNIGLPSVAVLSDGTVGVLYDSYEGTTPDGFPIVAAHLARSTDQGVTFSDTVLEQFATPKPEADPLQDALGDYQQLKAVGDTFHGVFAGNTLGVPSDAPVHAVYFKTTSTPPPPIDRHTTSDLTSSANPSIQRRPVTFTDIICPVDPRATETPTGGVFFKADGKVIGTGALSPGGGTHCSSTSITTSRLRPGRHIITAYYSGDRNYLAGPLEQLTQTVVRSGHRALGGDGSGGEGRKNRKK